MDEELVYYRNRAQSELEAASAAPSARIRDVHLELANAYALRVRYLDLARARPAADPVSGACAASAA